MRLKCSHLTHVLTQKFSKNIQFYTLMLLILRDYEKVSCHVWVFSWLSNDIFINKIKHAWKRICCETIIIFLKKAKHKTFLKVSFFNYNFRCHRNMKQKVSFISILTEPSNFHHFFVIFSFHVSRDKATTVFSVAWVSLKVAFFSALINFSSSHPPVTSQEQECENIMYECGCDRNS